MRSRWRVSAALTVPVLLAACGSSSPGGAPSGPGSSAPSSSSGLQAAKTSRGTVLTNANGFTLYWFSPGTSATPKCSGAGASAWPPVAGLVGAAAGVSLSGKLATITRPDGSQQET